MLYLEIIYLFLACHGYIWTLFIDRLFKPNPLTVLIKLD